MRLAAAVLGHRARRCKHLARRRLGEDKSSKPSLSSCYSPHVHSPLCRLDRPFSVTQAACMRYFRSLRRTIHQLQSSTSSLFEKLTKVKHKPAAMAVHLLKNVFEPRYTNLNTTVVADIIAALGGDSLPQSTFFGDDSGYKSLFILVLH